MRRQPGGGEEEAAAVRATCLLAQKGGGGARFLLAAAAENFGSLAAALGFSRLRDLGIIEDSRAPIYSETNFRWRPAYLAASENLFRWRPY